MINFHKSPTATFEILNHIQITNQNVLYLTHEIDQIKKIVMKIHNVVSLQKQVDEYFTKDEIASFSETSPQTKIREQ